MRGAAGGELAEHGRVTLSFQEYSSLGFHTAGSSVWPTPPPPTPPPPPPETPELDAARQRIMAAVDKRRSADRRLSVAWVIVPFVVALALSIVGMAMMMDDIFALFEEGREPTDQEVWEAVREGCVPVVIGSAFEAAAFTVLIYLMLLRQNRHFARESEFREGVMAFVSAAATASGTPGAVVGESRTMESSHRAAVANDKSQPALLLTILFAVPNFLAIVFGNMLAYSDWGYHMYPNISPYSIALPLQLVEFIVVLYILRALGTTGTEHSSRWNDFTWGALYGLYKVGKPATESYSPPSVKELHFGLFVLLSILTLGLFIYYWLYRMVKDPNRHYEAQWRFEDLVVRAVARF